MRRVLAVAVMLATAQAAPAAGLLIPTEKKLPPLAMLNHQVTISIEDQVAITKIEQTFRNHTDRQLEATYIFPVPKGASVRKFSMWVDGKEVSGELVEADKARKIYTDIVQRTLDPGLLEYMGNNLLKLRVFPVPPKGDQKIMISYTSVATSDSGLIEYTYPLKTDGKATSTLEKFALNVNLKSQHTVTNIYSPTHAITIQRPTDKEAVIGFEKDQALLDKDFQLFYTAGTKDVGLTALTHRPSPGHNGYFMLLVSPRAELSKEHEIPRDMILVLDTSGSMRGKRMIQARNALKYCLANLSKNDRFALLNFATTVNKYHDNLLPANTDEIERAKKWVDALEATGGTAINDALDAALALRPGDDSRPFTIVFFTDGRPTIGETNTDKILANVAKKNNANTRIFTFGVGDDVNASMLDKLAEDSRAISTYVRESEDIESRVSSLFSKISNPVLANLKLSVSGGITLNEIYPPQLPDLFHGTQLVILGRYTGQGHAAVKLLGSIGKDSREFVYELSFPDKTGEERNFVEDLWARRKVGYLLDQIRLNGDKKELLDEVVSLAKRYGITTPYTSYLVVPDGPMPVARRGGVDGRPNVAFQAPGLPGAAAPPPLLVPQGPASAPLKLEDAAKKLSAGWGAGGAGIGGGFGGAFGGARDELAAKALERAKADPAGRGDDKSFRAAAEARETLKEAERLLRLRDYDAVQAGRLGVNLSLQTAQLRGQTQLTQTATRHAGGRQLLEIGGVWLDEGFSDKTKTLSIKAMSPAYFRMLERHPTIRDVFRLGNHLVWLTPSGTALVVDLSHGQEQMSDADIDRLFQKPAAK